MNTESRFLGLALRTPLVVGAGPLTWSVPSVVACAQAGAGAVVLPSLFEEDLLQEAGRLDAQLADQAGVHAEAAEFLRAGLGLQLGSRAYLKLVSDCKAAVDIPVIASLNCVSPRWWGEFAAEIAAAGADALELNLALMPVDPTRSGRDVEEQYLQIVRAARAAVRLPLAVKVGPWFSALPEMLARFGQAGADGFVLFNRFYQPDIDVERLAVRARPPFSHGGDYAPALRWIAQLAGRVPGDFAAASGIHDGAAAVRMLLAGAGAVQVVSTLVKNGINHLQVMQRELEAWMRQHHYAELGTFQGLLSQERQGGAELFSRLQYRSVLAAHPPIPG